MQEIKCPHCGQVFQVDETGYAQIMQQVRDREFDAELSKRLHELEDKRKNDLKLARMEQEKDFAGQLSRKTSELAEKDLLIEKLKTQLQNAETDKKLAVTEAMQKKDKEYSEEAQKKEKELFEKSSQITELKGQLAGKDAQNELKEKALVEKYDEIIKNKDEQIEYYKDFKARQSTKMVGESLEQHCQNQFNSIRMTAFPKAYFEKDNDAKSGSKGDFIFREAGDDGTEFISIMFEMKNEMDETGQKHKNEDFFKKLDKDRNDKNCEYAVLVSLLELDNDYYNNGIVDVSYRYEKMYVIRPQFFIPMITLLRNAALNSLAYKQELAIVKNQQLDIMHFEENLDVFKSGFQRNYDLASRKFQEAIDDIDKSINALQKTKEALLSSNNNLRLANDKAQDLSIKKLTKNAPSVKEMFENLP